MNFLDETKLENLFKEWSQRMLDNGDTCLDEKDNAVFVKDGLLFKNTISNEQIVKKWCCSPKRILFLLKDQHQFGNKKWSEDIRFWLKDIETDKDEDLKRKRRNRDLGNRFMKHIGYILWGLSKADEQNDWKYNEVIKHQNEVKEFFNTQPFAVVECKKYPGDGKLDDIVLKRHLNNYGDLVKREIEILKPNMIVCTSTLIYDFIINNYPQEELVCIEGHNSIRFHPQSETILLCSYHPSAFGKNAGKKNYDSVMNHYRAFLKR